MTIQDPFSLRRSRPRGHAWLAAVLSTFLAGTSSQAAAPAGRYAITNDTVSDTITGLTWQRFPALTQYTWADAQTACSTLALGGGTWRVPALKELLSIVDYQGSGTMIDPTAFPNTPQAAFWSVTPISGHYWLVEFAHGMTFNAQGTGVAHVRCVR